MKDGEIIEMFKSMIDIDPLEEGYICFWCRSCDYSGVITLHLEDCQWIQAMDLFGLAHPDHVTKETS